MSDVKAAHQNISPLIDGLRMATEPEVLLMMGLTGSVSIIGSAFEF
jgi:hypothetical protein